MARVSSAVAALAAVTAAAKAVGAASKPHVIMMLADDWGSYDASWRMRELGREPDIHTPHIDSLSSTGVRFANYYVQPICTPTRSVLMSGRYTIHTGCEHILFGASEPSCLPVHFPLMPHAFKELGYQTHMVGKWHLGYANDTCAPWTRGFDSYIGYLNGVEGYYAHGMGPFMDFHECVNNTDDGPDQRNEVDARPHGKPVFRRVSGAMPSEHNASNIVGGPVQTTTFESAINLCIAAGVGCLGFTFEEPSAEPGQLIKVYFKKSVEVNGNSSWTSYLKQDIPTPKTCDKCTYSYEGIYSTNVYATHMERLIRRWQPGDKPIFLYAAWQAVHEPMDAPARYIEPYSHIEDASRRIYAGMLTCLDEAIGNVTIALKQSGLYSNTVLVLSNDNGGMSGTYGMGCCNCGTSCGGLNYPYRGWKDSFWEGGFRGIGFLHSPLLKVSGYTYRPLLHVSDWYRTLLSAALVGESSSTRAETMRKLRRIIQDGPIDSVDQWDALNSGAEVGPRSEILLAGIDSDKHGAAIRVGHMKLLVGNWGTDTWCDLNITGFSPVAPAPVPTGPTGAIGGKGGLVCIHLNETSRIRRAGIKSEPWDRTIKGLFNVSADPRELHDLQQEFPEVVKELMSRLAFWNATTVPSVHKPEDPAGTQHANATQCWSPWLD